MLTEVDSFSSTLDALSGIVNDTNSRKARLSLISAEDVFVPLTEAIHIFDQLEQVLKQIESFEWYLADYQANKLVVRLQDCNSALFLQLSILQSCVLNIPGSLSAADFSTCAAIRTLKLDKLKKR